MFKDLHVIKREKFLVCIIALIFFAIYFFPGMSFQGDAASTVEIIDSYVLNTKLENISYAATFRGDSPLYPTLISLYNKLGLTLSQMTFAVNGIFFVIFSLLFYFSISTFEKNKNLRMLYLFILCLNFPLIKYFTAPLSYSFHAVWTGFVFLFLLAIEQKVLKLNIKLVASLICIAALSMINNYASIAYIGLIGFYLLFRKEYKYAIAFALFTPILFLLNIQGGGAHSDNVERVITNPINFPLIKTIYYIVRATFPFYKNYYLVSAICSFVTLFFILKNYKDITVRILLIGLTYFITISFFIFIFLDNEALINYKRAINVSYPLLILSCYLFSKNYYKFRKVLILFFAPYLLISFILYQYGIYTQGPRFNEYSMQKSEIKKFVQENIISENIVFYTNNSPTSYMLFRKRLKRISFIDGRDHLEKMNEIQKAISAKKTVYFLEFKDSDNSYMRIKQLSESIGYKEINNEDLLQLYELVVK